MFSFAVFHRLAVLDPVIFSRFAVMALPLAVVPFKCIAHLYVVPTPVSLHHAFCWDDVYWFCLRGSHKVLFRLVASKFAHSAVFAATVCCPGFLVKCAIGLWTDNATLCTTAKSTLMPIELCCLVVILVIFGHVPCSCYFTGNVFHVLFGLSLYSPSSCWWSWMLS